MDSNPWVESRELAELLGCTRTAAITTSQQAGFPDSYQWTPGGKIRWRRHEILDWIASRGRTPNGLPDAAKPVDRRRRPKVAA